MTFFFLLLIIMLGLFIWWLFQPSIVIHSHWFHPFDGLQFSSQEFYQSVQQSLEQRKIPGLSFTRASYVTKLRTIVFDERREYFCASREEYRFQICAAPFGTGFFVSYWFLEREPGYISIIKKIPLVRFLLEFKTFYQIDTEDMYRSFVHTCVLEAIDAMTTGKGLRALTEHERAIPASKNQ